MEKHIVRRIANRLLAAAARFGPGATSLRPYLHRLRGVRITGRVFVGDDVYIENEYPECVELEDGVQICLRSVLIAHTRAVGRIVIKKNVFVGVGCIIIAVPGRTLTIGEGAVITAASVVSTDVPPGILFGMDKAKPLAQVRVPLTMDTDYERFVAGLRPLPPLK